MLLLVVWIAVAVVAVVVLGGLLFILLGAVRRLRREVQAVQRDVVPVLGEVQRTLEAAAARSQSDR